MILYNGTYIHTSKWQPIAISNIFNKLYKNHQFSTAHNRVRFGILYCLQWSLVLSLGCTNNEADTVLQTFIEGKSIWSASCIHAARPWLYKWHVILQVLQDAYMCIWCIIQSEFLDGFIMRRSVLHNQSIKEQCWWDLVEGCVSFSSISLFPLWS